MGYYFISITYIKVIKFGETYKIKSNLSFIAGAFEVDLQIAIHDILIKYQYQPLNYNMIKTIESELDYMVGMKYNINFEINEDNGDLSVRIR